MCLLLATYLSKSRIRFLPSDMMARVSNSSLLYQPSDRQPYFTSQYNLHSSRTFSVQQSSIDCCTWLAVVSKTINMHQLAHGIDDNPDHADAGNRESPLWTIICIKPVSQTVPLGIIAIDVPRSRSWRFIMTLILVTVEEEESMFLRICSYGMDSPLRSSKFRAKPVQ